MHAIAEVIIPPTDDVNPSITAAMQYFVRENDDGEKPKDGHADWWDFWVIGGRFSGHKIECQLDPDKLTKFHEFLNEKKVTVSGVTCGKQTLQPTTQQRDVDRWWREWFPGCGDRCILFDHAHDQYGKHGVSATDICTVATIPDRSTCERLIIAGLVANGKEWGKNFEQAKAELGVVDTTGFEPRHPRWNEAWQKAHDLTPRTELCVKRMWATNYWNGVEHQSTAFDGNVKKALADMRAQQRPEDKYHWCGWEDNYLVVTVDYHN